MSSLMTEAENVLADATAEISDNSSMATKGFELPSLGDELGEVQSSATKATMPFGSPHISSPVPTSPLPASPLDAAAKQLDFDMGMPKPATPASPATPGLPVSSTVPVTPAPAPLSATPATWGSPAIGEDAEGTVDYDTFVKETLLWVNKVRSVVYLVGGILLIYVLHRVLSSDIKLVTGVCWVLLAQNALNFLRAFISPKLQARCTWHDSAWTAGLVRQVSGVIKGAAALHDKHMSGMDAAKTLRIVLGLWVVSLAGRVVGATGLASALWVLAFIVPKLYVTFQSKIDTVLSDVSSQAKSHFTKLDPKARAALVVVPIFVAGYALSSADLAVATLALALYGRSWMAPSQVDRLNSVVAPTITNTVSKVGGTVSNIVQSAVTKYELTPTPMKKRL